MTETSNGMSGHQSAAAVTVDWMTPPWLLQAVGGAASFDLDPCTAVNRPWDTAQRHFTQEDDGLKQEWTGRVWLNPPYSTSVIGRFMSRLVAHGSGMALIFARTETESFHENVWRAADAVLFLEGRLHFHVAEDTTFFQKGKDPIFVKRGDPTPTNAGAPSVLIAYGEQDTDMLAEAQLPGQFVPLKLRGFLMGFQEPGTWIEEVRSIMERADRPMTVAQLYKCLADSPKARGRKNWQAKVRQTLQRGPFAPQGDGVWQLDLGEAQ